MAAFDSFTTARTLWNAPLDLFEQMAAADGDWSHARLGWQNLYLASHPDLIKELLVKRDDVFGKGAPLRRSSILLGQGLLTSEGDQHRCQRRRIQPAFNKRRVNAHADIAAAYSNEVASGWRDGQQIDLSAEMMRLSQRIVAKALLDTDIQDARAREVGGALDTLVQKFGWLVLPFSGLLWHLPIPAMTRLHRARDYLDEFVKNLIEQRRLHGDQGDVISMMLTSKDDYGQSMPEELIRDEVMTLFLAGHDTTGNSLAWTFHLLAQNPEVEHVWYKELKQVLNGRLPTTQDLPKLEFTRRLFTESMRLFPPVPAVGRTATEDTSIGGHRVSKGSIVEVCPWVLHRDPRFFPNPSRFDPDRWTEDFTHNLPTGAYIPFGIGPRTCIGMPFAWMVGVVVMATLGQRWRLQSAQPGPVEFLPRSITLRPRNGLSMLPEARR